LNGTYTVKVSATDVDGQSLDTSMGTFVVVHAPAITSPSAIPLVIGNSQSFTITTSGYPIPSLSESGNLPLGVAFIDNGDGGATLTGSPAHRSAGTYPVTINASNGILPGATQSLIVTVVHMAITTTLLPSATVNAPYSATINAIGGNPPYKWFLTSGSGPLPPGLELNKNTGLISGTPTSTGTYMFAVKVVDTRRKGKRHSATQPFSITVT
jgi:hypothetical protein